MFLAPWFLLGLLAAGIPLLLHLRRSRQVRPITFSTTRFFDASFMRAARRARVQDLLLMLLRVAVLCLLALALAQPLIRWSGLPFMAGQPRMVAIVLDDSASMRTVAETGTRFDEAKRAAIALLDELSAERGDRVTLVRAGQREAGSTMLFDEPADDFDEARRLIRIMEPTDLATDLDAAIAAAAGSLHDATGGVASRSNLEAYVLSDLQPDALLGPTDDELPANLGVFFVDCSMRETPPANATVAAVQYGAARPMVGVPFAFRALVTNHGDATVTRPVALRVGEHTAAVREVTLAPGRSEVVRFVHRFTDPGWVTGRVELEPADNAPDALRPDDQRHFALHVADRLNVVAINGAPSRIPADDELFFVRLALTATGPRDRRHVQFTELPPDALADALDNSVDVVMLANVPRLDDRSLAALEQFVDAGGALLITLGDRVDRDAWNRMVGGHRLHGGLLPGPLRPARNIAEPTADQFGETIEVIAPMHPALAGFAEGEFGSFDGVTIRTARPVDAPAEHVLMQLGPDLPLLTQRPFGQGTVMTLGVAIDRADSNFPLQPIFVPWLYRIVSHLAQPAAESSGFLAAGSEILLPTRAGGATPGIRTPDGQTRSPEAAVSAEGFARFTETDAAGVYAILDPNNDAAPRRLIAVNTPPRESQPGALAQDDLAARMPASANWTLLESTDAIASAGRLARDGIAVWDYLLWIALAMALFEPWFANRLSRRSQTAAVTVTDPARRAAAPRREAA